MTDVRVPLEPTEDMVAAVKDFLSKGSWLSHPSVRKWRGELCGDTESSWDRDYCIALCKAMLAARPAESEQASAETLWTKNVFLGNPPTQYKDWNDFANSPIKSGVTIKSTESDDIDRYHKSFDPPVAQNTYWHNGSVWHNRVNDCVVTNDPALSAQDSAENGTPRTCAAAMEACGNCDYDAEGQAMVPIRFSRQLERELSTVRADAMEEAAKICHDISMAAYVEREAQRNGDFDHCSISEETGRYESAEECENAIRRSAKEK